MVFQKGHIPWIKGKTKDKFPQLADSGRKKGCITWNKDIKGIHLSPRTEFKRGHQTWNKNIPHSIKTKEKISIATKEYWKRHPEFNRGQNNPSWKGGITPETVKRLGNNPEWNRIRYQVYKRDSYVCQVCGKTNCRIIAHHIIPYRISKDNNLDNLIVLCQSCHMKLEYNSVIAMEVVTLLGMR